jgi:hypothetical protein
MQAFKIECVENSSVTSRPLLKPITAHFPLDFLFLLPYHCTTVYTQKMFLQIILTESSLITRCTCFSLISEFTLLVKILLKSSQSYLPDKNG